MLGEIIHIFGDGQQSFARSPLRENYIMAVKLNMKKLKLVEFVRVIDFNRRVVDQAIRWHKDTVDEQGMPPCYEEIGMWHIGRESRARNANWQRVSPRRLG